MIKALLRRLSHRLFLELQKRRLKQWYTPSHEIHDLDTHLDAAVVWLKSAQDAGPDDGIAYGTQLGEGWMASYPESTGYIIPTLLRVADLRGDEDLRERAVRAGLWEISIQMPSGAVMAGRVTENPVPALFNTGQVLHGWSALYSATGRQDFHDAAIRAADWMLEMQEANGQWLRGNSPFCIASASLYNVRAAWGLSRFGQLAGRDDFVQAGIRNGEFVMSRQHENGWFPDNCLDAPEMPLLHTIAYSMRGLYELGALSEREDFISAAQRTADGLLPMIAADGFISGRVNKDFIGVSKWACLTGQVQLAIVLFKLARHSNNPDYADAAMRLNRYVMARQVLNHPNPQLNGGVAGAWPIWGGYGEFRILNWAVKFLVDALLEERAYTQGQA